MTMNLTGRSRLALLLGSALLTWPLRALPLSWEATSGWTVDLDTTLTYGAQWRVQGEPVAAPRSGTRLCPAASLSERAKHSDCAEYG